MDIGNVHRGPGHGKGYSDGWPHYYGDAYSNHDHECEHGKSNDHNVDEVQEWQIDAIGKGGKTKGKGKSQRKGTKGKGKS